MHEQVGVARSLEHGAREPRVRRHHDLAAGPRRPEQRPSASTRPSASVTLSPRWSTPRSGPGDPERIGGLDVEPSRPRRLDQRVAERGDAVLDRERRQHVLLAVERVARLELDERVVVGELPEDPPQ